jgi:5-(aminomethyl)-3-furanmethanol phosphate kinase
MWIVKIGGSLARSQGLDPWLTAVAGAKGGARLVVPGGGPFADAIRGLQEGLAFDDRTAHRMALLSMQQFGLFLHAREPRLALVETPSDVEALREKGGAGVWLPWAMFGRDSEVPASWDATSDSMALLLAIRTRAHGLVLVKSALLPAGEATAGSLAQHDILDLAFPRLLLGYGGPVILAHRDRPRDLAAVMAGEGRGCRVDRGRAGADLAPPSA